MSLILSLIVFFAVTALIFLSWFLISKFWLSGVSLRILSTIIFSLSQVILTTMTLGLAAKLFLPYLIILNVIISVFILWIAIRYKSLASKESPLNLRELFRNKLFVAIFILFVLIALRTLVYGILLHPYDYDGLEYHLPVIVEYMQHGKIADMQSNLFTRSFYPYTIELTYLWNLIFLKNDLLLNLSQFFYAIIGSISIFCLSRYFKISRSYSAIAAMLWFFIPIVIIQSTVLYIDLATSSILLATIYFLLKYFDDRKLIYLILLSLSGGIYLGTKFSALFILAIIGVSLLIFSLIKKVGVKKILIDLAIFLAGLILLSGYWYIKNTIKYHNPIYPHTVTVLGRDFLPGFVPLNAIMDSQVPPELLGKPAYTQWYLSWVKSPAGYIFDSRIGGFGPIWFALCLPAIAIFIYLTIAKKDKRALLFSLIFLTIFFIHPANWWSRYVMFITGFGLVSLMYVFEKLERPIKLATAIVMIFLAGFVFLTTLSDSYLATSPSNLKALAKKSVYLPDQTTDPLTGYVHNMKNTKIGYGPGRFLYSAYGEDFSNQLYFISDSDCNAFYKKVKDEEINYFIINNNIIGMYAGWPGQYIKDLDDETKCVKNSGNFSEVYESYEGSPYSLWEPNE